MILQVLKWLGLLASAFVVGAGAMGWLLLRTGYQDEYFRDCSTNGEVVAESLIGPASLRAFLHGHSRSGEPIELIVRHGETPFETYLIEPDAEGRILWAYSGDWYDDFRFEIRGSGCRVTMTYRL